MSSDPQAPEGRNLVLFCDGTWNSPDEESYGLPTPTNVYKLYQACQDEADSAGAQLTWYLPGVGSDGSSFRRALEGATGTGIGLNIRRGYAALAALYRGPQDRIFLVGFSRGAFTARSIAGMIQKVGLTRSADPRRVKQAYRFYERSSHEQHPQARQHREREDVHRDVRVHAIGVWDTVGALGLSVWGWSFNFRALWRNDFHRLSANQITDHVVHALALDEKRTSFMPLLWHPPGDFRGVATGCDDGRMPHVTEAWFRGVHSDVGGGYADTRLSDVALQWMVAQLVPLGLRLRPGLPRLRPDPAGRVHNSARGPLWTNVATWPRWTPLRTAAEAGEADAAQDGVRRLLHESIAERELQAGALGERRRQRLAPGQRVCVSVQARQPWDYTGIVLEHGARYRLRASGLWQDRDDRPVGPAGQAAAEEGWPKRLGRWMKRARGRPWMELIALPCTDFGWRWGEFGLTRALRFLLLQDPGQFTRQLVPVGEGVELAGPAQPGAEAMLWCFANDARKFYGNNAGSITLEVERLV